MLVLLLHAAAILALYSVTKAHPTMRRDNEFTADIRPNESNADTNATGGREAYGRHTTALETAPSSASDEEPSSTSVEKDSTEASRHPRHIKSTVRRRPKYRRICHFAPIQCLLDRRRPKAAFHPEVLAAANNQSLHKVTATVSTDANFSDAWLKLGHRLSREEDS